MKHGHCLGAWPQRHNKRRCLGQSVTSVPRLINMTPIQDDAKKQHSTKLTDSVLVIHVCVLVTAQYEHYLDDVSLKEKKSDSRLKRISHTYCFSSSNLCIGQYNTVDFMHTCKQTFWYKNKHVCFMLCSHCCLPFSRHGGVQIRVCPNSF